VGSRLVPANHSSSLLCISGPSFASLSNGGNPYGKPRAADAITVERAAFTAREGHSYTLIEGRAGTNVKATTINLADGTQIEASTGNG